MAVIIPRLPRRSHKTERIKERQSMYQRSDYRKAVDFYKREHIFCEECIKEGLYTPGTDLHHVQSPFQVDLSYQQQLMLLYDQNNWKLLCNYHHRLQHGTASKEEIDEHNKRVREKKQP